ncbi:tetratricopeptide repeat protein [Pseudanabaena mucicola]|uniref:ATP-binding protein n=1 Tax=Pseudanabaena mucicola FACHB-723 TaxID=2692860 RepID=A0ABR7ZYQ7_9CYAN|nr:tetratricopeptide repeat protein [Pseudanabaena mucicola]MBD2188401.1 ATP-binding protein [Pseudanabaena mucicola FACHB-723]
MDEQIFLKKFKELESPAKPYVVMKTFLVHFLQHGKSQKEIAKSLEIDISNVSRRLKLVCKHFDIKYYGRGGLHEDDLINLFRKYKPDFLHPSILHGLIDDNRFQPPTASQSNSTPKLTTSSASASAPNFIGRDDVLVELDIKFKQNRLVLLLGVGGRGKSTVARFYGKKFDYHDFFKVASTDSNDVQGAASLVDKWLQDFWGEEIGGQQFRIKLERFRKLLTSVDVKRPICFVIDNIEPALVDGWFKDEHKQYIELLEVLSDPFVGSITLITSREPINEHRFSFETCRLPRLCARSWHEYFQSYGVQISEESLGKEDSAINKIHGAYDGNAACMAVLCANIVKNDEYGKDLEAFWNANQEDLLRISTIEGLFDLQFERLQKHNLDAYNLLCRMGCYRYQGSVDTVPEEGITALFWEDKTESKLKAKRVIQNLRDFCLIDFLVEKKGYLLHPVMRQQALSRLRDSSGKWTEEGIKANQKAAEFWKKSFKSLTNRDDALKAFEAYHHYININEFALAGEVITQTVTYKETSEETLGGSLYRLGLLSDIRSDIRTVVNHMTDGYQLSRIYNILGDVCWLMGDIKEAIDFHETSKEIAIKYDLPRLQAVAFLNIGLCQIELWELEQAKANFEECIKLSKNIDEEKYKNEYTFDSYYCLSFVNSVLGFRQEAIDYAEKVQGKLEITNRNSWSKCYRWLFMGKAYMNLSDFEKSFFEKSLKMYKNAQKEAKDSQYTQVEANALVGLATLDRMKSKWDDAISNYDTAIEKLNKIGGNCDLAEAYFQRALTHQAMGKHFKAQKDKDEALKLFAQMKEAPKQIERVNKAFGGNIQRILK